MAATALGRQTYPSGGRGRLVFGAGDDRLVARVRAGDDTAFEAIYDRYARRLLAFCYQMLGSREEAEDALQHSVGSAYRMLRATESDVELRPWLYTIARNRCLSVLRARRRDISLDAAPEYGGVGEGLADQVQRRSDLRELVDDLRSLPDDQRAALVLFELGGLPQDEIAAVLEVRREKVKALVFQAREGLIRDRRARELPCTEIREQLATLAGKVPRRSMLRRHVDRCASCALYQAEVGRQSAGLGLILPVLPAAGLKSLVLGAVLSRGAGAGSAAGGGAAALGGASGGGGGLACAGAGGGAAGVAGAGAGTGAATGGGILATAAAGGAGGVGGTVATATAGGAGTIAAAIGVNGASTAVVKLMAVVAIGGGVASTGNLDAYVPALGHPPASHQTAPTVAAPSPTTQELLAPATRPATAQAPTDAASPTVPAVFHDPLLPAASDPLAPATVSHPGPVAAAPAPAAPASSPPATGGASPGPAPAPATTAPPTTAPPSPAAPATPASSTPAATTPAATQAHQTPTSTTVSGGTPAPASATTPAAGPAPTTTDPGATNAPATGGTPVTGSPAPAPDVAPTGGTATPADPATTTPGGTPAAAG